MSKYNFIILLLSTLLFVIQFSLSNCRPHHTQKLIVHGHEWTVPNEDGWEEVLNEAEPYRHRHLTNCASSRECRLAAERLRQIFLKYPVSAKYYDNSLNNDLRPNDIDSIFKWG